MSAPEENPEIDWGNERLTRAQRAVETNIYDVDSWSLLIREAQTRSINEVRSMYEKLITAFPTTGRYWKIYIEQEMKQRNFERVEKLFQRCLMKILNIELWRLYLNYVKETKCMLPTYKEKMAQAYDFALEKIGMDIHAYPIWTDYVTFLKSVDAVGSYAENQKISAVRKVYQRAVITPIIGIESLWKDYIAFEQSINTIIAERMAMERSREYMNARRVAKELEGVTRGLNRNMPATPPAVDREEMKQVELWKKYIAWERSNPLRSEDTALVARRVMFAIEQCLLCLAHHPDVWHQAAQFLDHSAKLHKEKGDSNAARLFSDEAAAVYARATGGPLQRSTLLHFAHADYEESRLHYNKVHQVYTRYLDMEDIDPTLAYVQYMKFARRAEGIKSARTVFKRAREDPRSRYHVFVAAALMEYYCSKDKNIAFRIFELGLKKFSNISEYVLCYIDYLSHLNEDNNTRVLFERVLSSGSLKPECSVDIWNRFLEFESNIGDLVSIVKVEKRRQAVLEKIKEFEGKETAQLVDRYKFLDLYPCSIAELKSIGYTEVASMSNKSWALGGPLAGISPELAAVILGNKDNDPTKDIARPDTSQMIPYKPKINPLPGEHPIPGGSFPLPAAAAALCAVTPPPSCFRGPFVAVDALLDLFRRLALPEHPPAPTQENGCDMKLFDLARSVHWIVDSEGITTVASKLFQRCLMKILNIELWRLYLNYVKETKCMLPTYKEKMAQAYDFALEKIGMDIHAYPIWTDYVTFLKSVDAVGSYAENQKISAVRKVYQRAVITPIIGIESLWKDYIAFEQSINTIIAERMAMERSREYMNARRVAKELEGVTRGLNRNMPATPPAVDREEMKQVELWKKYIAWERSNPLRSEDTALVARRVMFAIEQCLLCLAHHPDVWHQAAQFLDHSAKLHKEKGDSNAARLFSDEAAAVYARATGGPLQRSTLLHFAHADYEESRLHYNKVHQVYTRYLDMEDIDPTLAYVQYMKFARRAEGIKSARTVFKRAREDPRSRYHVFVAAALMEYYCSKDKNIAFRIFELGLKKFSNISEYVLCYIDYLSHLNEDNNTRVLFERVLSSGSLKPECSVDIWNRFLEFESNIGDLVSIVKVEKRRQAVLEKIKEFEGKETAQLVDRYKFLDLYPCSIAELKSIGYTEVASMSNKSWALGGPLAGISPELAAVILGNKDNDPTKDIARPDTSQMIPYKPKINPLPGEHPIPGGSFPLPAAAAALCAVTPPPSCFRGPFVAVDALLDLFRRLALPEHPPAPTQENGCDMKLFDLARSVHWIVDSEGITTVASKSRRRKAGEDSDDDDMGVAPPVNDIYRQRQQKRVK